MTPNTTPSWDLFLAVMFVVGIAYGFLLQRGKVILTLITVYVAILITQVLSPLVSGFFTGDKTVFGQFFIKANASPFTVKTALFILTIILLTTRSGLSSTGSRGLMAPIEVLLFSGLNVALVISTIFSFMPPERQEVFKQASKLAKLIIERQTWWLLLPVVLLIVVGFRRRRRDED